jgi:hypothetical protein
MFYEPSLKKVRYHQLLLLIITEIIPVIERTTIHVSGERGDCVVAGEDPGAVVG